MYFYRRSRQSVTMTMPTQPALASLASLAVHAGRDDLEALGVHALPIDLSSTAPAAEHRGRRTGLRDPRRRAPASARHETVYRRAWNSTVARFEERHGGAGDSRRRGDAQAESVAFASGMAAMSAVLLSRVAAGRPHVVAIRALYGGTDQLLATGLLGTHGDVCRAARRVPPPMRSDTGLVVVESPANPTLELHDIRAIASAGR